MAEIPIYQVYTPGSAAGDAFLAECGLSWEQVGIALRRYAEQKNRTVGTIIGASVDGVIFTPVKDWQRDSGLIDITIVPWHEIFDLCRSILDDF
jgi:hypothetical protein